MQASRIVFALLFVFGTLSTVTQAQLFEDFEDGDKGSYAGGSVELSSGFWFIEDALIGSLSNDKFNGDQGVRMDRRNDRLGNIYMEFDKAGGADEVSFFFANYGSSTDNVLQVQYSTDGGSIWENLGDPLAAPATLEQRTIPVQVDGNIRFKFVHSAGTDRLNIDDIRITDYITPAEIPTISVAVNDVDADSGSTVEYPTTFVDEVSSKTVKISNLGTQTLNISEVYTTGEFTVTAIQDSSLEFGEETSATLSFEPVSGEGVYTGSLVINSNADNYPMYIVEMSSNAISQDGVISIADARTLPLGTIVNIAGVVTVAEEFRGPMYFQDVTGGMAWYNDDMRGEGDAFLLDVSRGDSIVITGELGEFNDLIQIVGTNVEYEFLQTETEISPVAITLAQMNSGDFEGQLVAIDVSITNPGTLQGNTNYEITDGTGTGQMRISAFSDIAGSDAPTEESTVVGVIGIFSGTYQLLPRDLDDIDAEVAIIPGEDVSRDETFDVVTWNIEWFGAEGEGNGPDDEDLQLQNVKEVITMIDADVYALQEISSAQYFDQLVEELDEYSGFRASFSQAQKTAFLFKKATVDSLDSGLITTAMTTSNWANGRFPLFFRFETEIGESKQEVYMYNIHAKAFADADSYDQRVAASGELKTYLDVFREDENIIFLGDYNDEIGTSIFSNNDSPYKNFQDDEEFTILTKTLEDRGVNSQSSGSMIDHITISSELMDEYFVGTERAENTSYISNYLSATSDHFPIWVRFKTGMITPTEEEIFNTPTEISLKQNYPNPFNPSTTISYSLSENSKVTLDVFDLMGRKVATLVNGKQNAGEQSVSFDANSLASGVYIYRLVAGSQQFTRKMILLK